jgi:6-methylsalicylate decarboxylase
MPTAAHDGPYGLVDTHAHFTTDSYIGQAKALGFRNPDGMPEEYWPRWSPEEHLDLMGRAGVARSILSMSSPGVHFGDPGQARKLAREVNLAAAEVKAAHPGQFGFFASLPLPSVDDSLAEIEMALDELHADGFVLMTNVAGRHLGARELAPVLEELDRRGAVVLLHPTSCIGHESLSGGRPQPMLEFLFDTARTVVDLVLSGAAERFGAVGATSGLPAASARSAIYLSKAFAPVIVTTSSESTEASRGRTGIAQ